MMYSVGDCKNSHVPALHGPLPKHCTENIYRCGPQIQERKQAFGKVAKGVINFRKLIPSHSEQHMIKGIDVRKVRQKKKSLHYNQSEKFAGDVRGGEGDEEGRK